MINVNKLLLLIMDGVGIRKEDRGNAFNNANHPNLDYLMNNYPFSVLEASGEAVGLPVGQMGNSEVGHMNIGAGRIVYQPLQLISHSIETGELFQNKQILQVINHTKNNHSKLHIMGLLSDGGIHSHIDHLMGIIDMCDREGIADIYFHLFLDGRDTLPNIAKKYIKQLEDKIKQINKGTICTLHGRYYAMDRDNNWDRIKLSYDAIVNNKGEHYDNPYDAIDANYKRNITDEFVIPCVINDVKLADNDGVIVFNFRPDRIRELFSVFTNPSVKPFDCHSINNIKMVTMMPVSDQVVCLNAFELSKMKNTFGEYISLKGLKQLRIAETEKYAHVTYFFDGGEEKKLKNCDRVLIPSSKVATYDLKPEMSVYDITNKLIDIIDEYDVVILNFANGDMVGHTGSYDATLKAVEAMDECIGKIYKKVKNIGMTMMITADHGNCEVMLDDRDNNVTSHSTSLVPLIITDNRYSLKNGKLGDIAPTMLKIMDLDIPKEMTGEVLVKSKL